MSTGSPNGASKGTRWLDHLSENWPIYARLTGVAIGFSEMAAGFFGLPVSTPVLVFATSLLIAPKVASFQERRNTNLPDEELAWARDTMLSYTKGLGPRRQDQILAFGSAENSS